MKEREWNPSPRRIELFWRWVDKSGGGDACWPWRLVLDEKGYGHCRVDGWPTTAHRAAYAIDRGEKVQLGVVIMHRCDNRACCNPRHLRAGTQADNMRDMFAKGRDGDTRNFGEEGGRCKITDRQVDEIISLSEVPGWSHARIGLRFGIGATQVRRILCGESRLYRRGSYPVDRGKPVLLRY